jgi:inorganic phosphate transporter, PiT family
LGLPNSSSHCLIGALNGVGVGNAFARSRDLGDGVHWPQLWKVLDALAVSPILGFVLAGALYLLCRKTLRDEHLYRPTQDRPPVWWMRGVLILTCSGVSFAHGTNDGQKSIGLIMLTIIGLFPATYALNPHADSAIGRLPEVLRQAEPLIQKYGDDERQTALDAAHSIERSLDSGSPEEVGSPAPHPELQLGMTPEARRKSSVRDEVYRVISQLKHAEETNGVRPEEKKQARNLAKQLGRYVEYAPWWVRILSAVCLGLGTMFGYRRIVTTLGERLGNLHLTPAQGASAEVIAALLIGTAGFTGLPVSTTHIVTAGIGGTMVSSGAGLRYGMISRIAIAWLLTLPVTILVSGSLYYILADPKF